MGDAVPRAMSWLAMWAGTWRSAAPCGAWLTQPRRQFGENPSRGKLIGYAGAWAKAGCSRLRRRDEDSEIPTMGLRNELRLVVSVSSAVNSAASTLASQASNCSQEHGFVRLTASPRGRPIGFPTPVFARTPQPVRAVFDSLSQAEPVPRLVTGSRGRRDVRRRAVSAVGAGWVGDDGDQLCRAQKPRWLRRFWPTTPLTASAFATTDCPACRTGQPFDGGFRPYFRIAPHRCRQHRRPAPDNRRSPGGNAERPQRRLHRAVPLHRGLFSGLLG